MATANVIPPKTFVEHATRLRTRKLEKLAASLPQDLKIHFAPAPPPKTGRRDLGSVLEHFRGRLR